MKSLKFLMMVIASLLFSSTYASDSSYLTKVEFFKGSVLSAKEKAKAENKQYFLEFYADWCKPCKWMEENTYTNDKLAEYIHENYVAVKVNIDDFDGHALKQKYQVEYLPTIIIFNEDGELLGKIEKSLNASKFLKELKDYRSAATVTTNQNDQIVASTDSRPAYTPTKSNYSKTVNQSMSSNESRMYSVQVGVFKNPNNVFKQVEVLKQRFNEPVQVYNEKDATGTTVIYRLTVGKFYSQRAANEYLLTVKNSGMEGFVKDISDMQEY